MSPVEIYSDGGCEPNPGPGGYGGVLIHPKKRKEVSGGFRKTINNRLEIYAAIAGLELLKQPCKATIYGDSKYGRVRSTRFPGGDQGSAGGISMMHLLDGNVLRDA